MRMDAETDNEITGMYEVLDALAETLKAANPDKREKLANTIDAYTVNYPDDFDWAVGPRSPTLLHHLLETVYVACRPETQSKPRSIVSLVDRKPESGH